MQAWRAGEASAKPDRISGSSSGGFERLRAIAGLKNQEYDLSVLTVVVPRFQYRYS